MKSKKLPQLPIVRGKPFQTSQFTELQTQTTIRTQDTHIRCKQTPEVTDTSLIRTLALGGLPFFWVTDFFELSGTMTKQNISLTHPIKIPMTSVTQLQQNLEPCVCNYNNNTVMYLMNCNYIISSYTCT